MMNDHVNVSNAVNCSSTHQTQSLQKMDSDDSDDPITIVGDAFSTNNARIVVNQPNTRPADTAVNSLPYKCKLCGKIFQLLEAVKFHYEKVHIRHKGVMCKIVDDKVYDNVGSPSQLSNSCEEDENDNDNVSSHESVGSCADGSTASVCPPQENISENSQSTSETLSPRTPPVQNDTVLDTINEVIKRVAAQPSPSNDDHRYAMKLKFMKLRKSGRPKKTFKSQALNRIVRLHTFNRVAPPIKNVTKRIVKEVKKDLVPLPKVCDWFTNCYPLRDPYYPQIEDRVLVFVSAYKKYEECLTKECSVLKKQDMVPQISQLYQFNGVVREIKFEYRNLDGSKYVILMTVESERGHQVKLLWCSYPKPEYIVLRKYNSSGDWLVGDRFRSLVNQAWWLGYITKFAPQNPQSLFHCFEVKFDSSDDNETECLSPWDLFKENTSRKPKKVNAGVPLYTDELSLLLYTPDADEWPTRGRNVECERILKGIRALLTLNIGALFIDLSSKTLRYSSVHDLDLHVVISRLEHTFYRRIKAVLFDVRLVKQTIFLCDFDSDSKQKAKLVLEVLEQFISKPECNDFLQLLRNSLPLSDLDIKRNDIIDQLSQPTASKNFRARSASETSSAPSLPVQCSSRKDENSEYACIWRDDCVKLIDEICKEQFAKPFIEPVSLVDFPDYRTFIKEPIDLKTIRGRLESKFYSSPDDMKKDIWLLISNSRHYNASTKTPIYHYTTQLQKSLDAGMTKIVDEFLATERLQKRARRKLI